MAKLALQIVLSDLESAGLSYSCHDLCMDTTGAIEGQILLFFGL